ncbi:ComF family protein [Ectothiorhodospira lacustris]|uniref:ComF family protein n=1 Tax=Ectothiorhodospira lacustris TaxID=2899127 RepID=UPI001EE9A0B1|nr:ComF family protein [Ectothiorhodospira lacustris]MCG5499753.1 ComF family protein [Ectothiorhodospira lacustris]MCG5509790.1 ComF family protein [Ectothiorhodospira lacustris]MCG5522296.1 ComF family protein [Ectothiorhodospira lacustris]
MIASWFGGLRGALLETAYPSTCLLCAAPGHAGLDLCAACRAELPRPEQACARCGLPLEYPAPFCGHCLRRLPPFDATWAALLYAPPVDGLIADFKFSARLPQGRLLGQLMAEALAPRINVPDCVIPVPLHRHRLRERGFNQALELARPLARALGCPLHHGAVMRVRATPPQQTLAATMRRDNLRGAFRVHPGFEAGHVALVDDVMTTGSTLREIAVALKVHGVKRVDVWVLARAA